MWPNGTPKVELSLSNRQDISSRQLVNTSYIQIFLKTPFESSLLIWGNTLDKVMQLKHNITQKTGYHVHMQNLIYGGKIVQDNQLPMYYYILSTSSITLNLRLRGGIAASSKIKVAGEGIGRSTSRRTKSK